MVKVQIISQTEKQEINNVRLLFGESSSKVKELFESVGINAVLSYMKGTKIVIPYIGEIELTYEGDEMTQKGREAKLKTTFTPSNFLIRNIGQVEDDLKTDSEEIMMARLRSVFKSKLDS